MNTEIVFIVEEDPEGGFTAQAIGQSIFTQGDTAEQLRQNVRDAVRCHFVDESTRPKIIRLHHVRDELLAA
jgi:predicted RNase H-like HicB family nuclease